MLRPMTAPQAPVPRTVPTLLAFVAGYIDGCTVLGLFGLYVAQVTGSFVVAGAHLVAPEEGVVIKIIGIPVFFGAAVATTLLVIAAGKRNVALVLSLVLETALIVGFLLTALMGAPFQNGNAPAALAAAVFGLSAMGVQSALVRLLFPGFASTNVMTTNTTLVAIEATEIAVAWWAVRRAPGDADATEKLASARTRLFNIVPLGFGFLAGTIAGTGAYLLAGFWCLLLATAIMIGLIVWALVRMRGEP
jgi:uncharacterized membrane protein YoaK (UPF0700 family)